MIRVRVRVRVRVKMSDLVASVLCVGFIVSFFFVLVGFSFALGLFHVLIRLWG